MADNPKIKISADVSDFMEQLQAMKSKIAELNATLKTGEGKKLYNFQGSEKELQALIKSAEKMQKALDSGDKSSKRYADNLKAAAQVLQQAAATSARLESVSGTSNSSTSGYFRTFGGELSSEAAALSIQTDRERTQARMQAERQAQQARIARSISGMVGAGAGAIANGGGGYSQLFASAGGLLPGPLGFAAGMVGGFAGGLIDKNMNGAKSEMRSYSELTRMIGDTSSSFEGLRDVVRQSVSNYAIANTEAAEMAKNFVKLTSSTDADFIGKAIENSASMAQQFGISSGKAGEFWSNSTLNGSTRNSADINRAMIIIAEQARKGGVSPKLEELLSSITGMIQRSASNTFTSQSIGGYADVLANGTSLPYAGLSKNPGSVAELINRASEFNSSNGGGESAQEQRTRALDDAFPKLGKWHPAIRQFGLYDDLSKGFDESSAIYREAKTDAEKAEVLRVRDAVKGKRLADVYGDRADKLGGNDLALRLGIIGAMNGLNPEQAAAFDQIRKMPGGYGALERKLDDYGIDKGIQGKYAGRYAELSAGGTGAAKAYFDKLKAEGTLSPELQAEGGKLTGKDLEKFVFSKIVPSQADDPGLQYQKASVQAENSIQKNLESLVSIETGAKELLMGLLQRFDKDSPILSKLSKQPLDAIGVSVSGKDIFDNSATSSGDLASAITAMRASKTKGDKSKIADAMIAKIAASRGIGYPMEAIKILKDEAANDILNQETVPGSIGAPPTISAGPGYLTKAQRAKVAQAAAPSKYDGLFRKYGALHNVDPMLLKMIGVHESSLNPNAISNRHSFGIMQHNSDFWGERGLNGSNWNDPETNIAAGAKFYAGLVGKYGSDESALYHYNGKGAAASEYSREVMGEYSALRDRLPEDHKHSRQEQNVNVTVNGHFDLNQNGQRVARAEPIFTTSQGKPRQAGVN